MKSIPYDVEAVRSKFPILDSHLKDKPLVYLDSAATALKPIEVVETLSRFYAEQYGTVHRAVYSLAGEATARYNESRVQVKKFIKASSAEEIIFTKGTTEAINLVASSFGQLLSSGDEVIITEMEHHSNIVPWQELCKQRQLTLKYIPMASNGELRMDIFRELLTHRTKLVSVAHIANSTGTINPIEEIISLSHAKGARVFIDGAQSAPFIDRCSKTGYGFFRVFRP
jgi:cysteine desulfurase/selenocysteine lyase